MNRSGSLFLLFRVTLFLLMTHVCGHATLLVWYRFDEAGGSLVTDSSGNGNHLSFTGAGAHWVSRSTAPRLR